MGFTDIETYRWHRSTNFYGTLLLYSADRIRSKSEGVGGVTVINLRITVRKIKRGVRFVQWTIKVEKACNEYTGRGELTGKTYDDIE